MDGARAPQGLDAEDKIALGLSAAHLFYLVVFSMAGWAILSSPMPTVLRAPMGICVLCAGAALAWGRAAGRPLDRWLWLYGLFLLRTRANAHVTVREAGPWVLPADAPPAGRAPRGRVTRSTMVTRRARRVAFYSQNGGSGKTTLAFESAALVASLSGARVAIVDLDFVSSTLRARSGLQGAGLGDLVFETPGVCSAPNSSAERVLLRHPAGVRIVLGCEGVLPQDALTNALGLVFDHLDEQGYDVVVVDVGTAALDHADATAAQVLDAVDMVYCVFNATPGGVMGAYRAIATLRRRGLRNKVRLITNRNDASVSLDEVIGDLRVDLVTSVPTLPGITRAESTHMPACLRDEVVADALYAIAEDIYPDMAARWFSDARPGQVAAGGAPPRM